MPFSFISSETLAAFTAVVSLLVCSTVSIIKWVFKKVFSGEQQPQQVPAAPPNAVEPINHDECAICLQEIEYGTCANCRHQFCINCITMYWNSQNRRQLTCPICRRAITIFVNSFEEPIANASEQLLNAIKQIQIYNHHYSGQRRSFLQQIRDAPFFINRLSSFIQTREGQAFLIRRVFLSHYVILGVLYLLSPFDLVPESIFGVFGLIDDLTVLLFVLLFVANMYYNHLARRDINAVNAMAVH